MECSLLNLTGWATAHREPTPGEYAFVRLMDTWGRYCYSSTAVPLAVPFFGCLFQQGQKPCSYIRTKMFMCPSSRAFPEVLVVQRAGLGGILEGDKGRSPLVPWRPNFLFFFNPYFCRIYCFFCDHPFRVWTDIHSTLSCSPPTLPPHTKFWGSVPHIPTPPPAPPIAPSVTLTPSKTCSTRVTFSSFASS